MQVASAFVIFTLLWFILKPTAINPIINIRNNVIFKFVFESILFYDYVFLLRLVCTYISTILSPHSFLNSSLNSLYGDTKDTTTSHPFAFKKKIR